MVAALSLVASLALAAESRAASVAWRGPPECADRRATVEEAERLLGRSMQAVNSLDFELEVEMTDERSWQLRLVTVSRTTQERRERLLQGTSCDEVVAAAAVAMAMVVNGSEPEPTSPAQVEPPPAEPEAKASRPATSPSAARAPASRKFSAVLSAALAGDVQGLPGFSLGGEVSASLRSNSWQLTALGALFSSSRELNSGTGADFDLALGGLLGCGLWGAGPTKILLCAGGEAGRLSGTGTGVRNSRSDGVFWWAPRIDAGLVWPVSGPLSVFGRLGLALPRARREFVVDEAFVHRPSALVVRAALGLELSL